MKNDPALTESGSAGSTTIPLARRSPSTASRTAARGGRSPGPTPSASGELRVGDRPRQGGGLELQGHREDDVPVAALEHARPVAEAAGAAIERDRLPRRPIPRAHRADRGGDLLPVSADVLDRGRSNRPGNAREALDPRQPVGDAAGDELVPGLARGDRQPDALAGPRDFHPAGRDPDGDPVEAEVGDHQVGAAGEQQNRLAVAVGGSDRGDEVGAALGRDQPACGTAEPQRRQLRQRGFESCRHPDGSLRAARRPSLGAPATLECGAFKLTIRNGPKVTREKHESLEEAVAALRSHTERIRAEGDAPGGLDDPHLRARRPGQGAARDLDRAAACAAATPGST